MSGRGWVGERGAEAWTLDLVVLERGIAQGVSADDKLAHCRAMSALHPDLIWCLHDQEVGCPYTIRTQI
jgi:hypothetical protein